jgi:hypothetical protein
VQVVPLIQQRFAAPIEEQELNEEGQFVPDWRFFRKSWAAAEEDDSVALLMFSAARCAGDRKAMSPKKGSNALVNGCGVDDENDADVRVGASVALIEAAEMLMSMLAASIVLLVGRIALCQHDNRLTMLCIEPLIVRSHYLNKRCDVGERLESKCSTSERCKPDWEACLAGGVWDLRCVAA